MRVTQKSINELTYKIIGCAIEVHKILGPGLLESTYEKCFFARNGDEEFIFQATAPDPY